jgi:hypothetical protein
MRYGVAVCAACRHARGLDLTAQTTQCPRCGKRQDRAAIVVLYRTDDPAHAAAAVGVVEDLLARGELGFVTDPRALQADVAARVVAREQAAAVSPAPPRGADQETTLQWAASRGVGAQGDEARATRVLAALDEALPDGFTLEQLEAAFLAAGLPAERAEKAVRRALARDELYEPRPGLLKRLG